MNNEDIFNDDNLQEERKQKLEVLLEFDAHDIALATVPGVEFDPKTRTFNQEELRPQPIIKKRKKRIVPEEDKVSCDWRIPTTVAPNSPWQPWPCLVDSDSV